MSERRSHRVSVRQAFSRKVASDFPGRAGVRMTIHATISKIYADRGGARAKPAKFLRSGHHYEEGGPACLQRTLRMVDTTTEVETPSFDLIADIRASTKLKKGPPHRRRAEGISPHPSSHDRDVRPL